MSVASHRVVVHKRIIHIYVSSNNVSVHMRRRIHAYEEEDTCMYACMYQVVMSRCILKLSHRQCRDAQGGYAQGTCILLLIER